MIINDLDGYYIVFDTKNWNTELDTLFILLHSFVLCYKYFLKSNKIPNDTFDNKNMTFKNPEAAMPLRDST